MIVFTANNKEYKCPHELKDVTFAKYCEYMNLTKSAPDLLIELTKVEEQMLDAKDMEEAELTDVVSRYQTLSKQIETGKGKKEFTEWKMRVVEMFTGLTYDEMRGKSGINIDSLNMLYSTIENSLLIKNVDEKIIDSVDIDGEAYYIAEPSTMTLGEFLEAAQVEEMNAKLGKGEYEAMVDIAAILLRKEGEEYSDELYAKNKERFKLLDMETIARIAFFFQKKSEQLLSNVLLSLASQELENLKAQRQTALAGTLS